MRCIFNFGMNEQSCVLFIVETVYHSDAILNGTRFIKSFFRDKRIYPTSKLQVLNYLRYALAKVNTKKYI